MISYETVNGYSNAFHPLEIRLASKALGVLRDNKFPLNRLQLFVQFNDLASKPYDHSLSLELEGRTATGLCRLQVSSLALQQDPSNMFKTGLTHEICHILSGCEAFKQSQIIKPHGPEWVKWMQKLGGEEIIEQQEQPAVDLRASALLGGAIFCRCGCDPYQSGVTIGQRSKSKLAMLKKGEIDCEVCGMAYRSVKDTEIPERLKDETAMLKEFSKLRSEPES